ncbi:MAG: SDR family NAD(P)-dependent oxidoreductase [Acidimicrobiaceae bacterium]|nr:SDR family NAD(P)-dependent oxidoreductase [Acidimicrobiaceae bacterium]MBO0748073.1 SDR family NAD(P)-dependent oxidoreductase [Acidimicrobiaceae bacterium]
MSSVPNRPDQETRPVAVVTGASSGIGAATVRHLAAAGFDVVVGARRLERLQELAKEVGPAVRPLPLDVTVAQSIEAFTRAIPACRVLVNNAGGALGQERVADSVDEKWLTMFETNVLGLMRMTRALLPKLIASGNGHIVNIGSVAAHEAYVGGAGYIAAKHGARGVNDVLRLELNGQPVRVSEIDPGMTETEFSLVRFDGDESAAARVYEGMTPLVADDIAEIVTFVVTRPAHVDIDTLIVRPRDQARTFMVHRS